MKFLLKKYYDDIKRAVASADELFIFGPAEAKKGLEKSIAEDKNFKPELLGVETADSMTKNQMVAGVKAFFAGVKK